MNHTPEPIAVTLEVVDAFETLGIPYFIGGSIASSIYGVTRSTLDSDLIADIKTNQASELVEKLGDAFYADEKMILDAIQTRASFNLIHLETMFKVDVFVAKDRSFDKLQFQRRVNRVLSLEPERQAYVATAEDMILAKLEWYRSGGETSDRQWKDIIGILDVQWDNLDSDYLRTWAEKLNVADLMSKALREFE